MYDRESARVYRYAAGEEFEQRLTRHLETVGLRVVPFGLERIIPAGIVRARIKADNSPLRSTPDYIASNGKRLIAIDAKSGPRVDAPHRHHCSAQSLTGLFEFERYAGIPTYLVFSDYMAVSVVTMLFTAEYVDGAKELASGREHGGTGQPFYSLACTDCIRLDRALGSVFT